MQDVRWKQRFTNFERAYSNFMESLNDPGFAKFTLRERQGTVQQFEILLELSWKLMKDYLEFAGVVISPLYPKNILREAFAAELIDNNEEWVAMLELRNELSHAYAPETFESSLNKFRDRFSVLFTKLYDFFQREVRK